ncbi:hypothetical protein [Hydrogenimonas cancrithermarum]|uniref:Uncharacterized protein n=1 Tax=Hydrogenimonas cancrithermarum TaxID=2993563 RepID=A0ABN6WUK9_9BACT|nr:hypothetical protein [Hydrogenimonas cancrithermarum]BDY12656.1 hypothetical protein HCR_09680 [Hydrogenimonas cancrithermarum]
MKKLYGWRRLKRMIAAGSVIAVTAAYAGPAAMFGVAYNIEGGDIGFTVKVLSNNEKNKVIAAGGATYYPWAPAKKFGLDASVGYLFDGVALTGGWDLLKNDFHTAVGYVNVVEDSDGSAPAADEGGSDGTPPPSEGTDGPT